MAGINNVENMSIINKTLIELEKRHKKKIIAIEGFSGNGKTTLANKIKNTLNNTQLVSIEKILNESEKPLMHPIDIPLPDNFINTYIFDSIFLFEKNALIETIRELAEKEVAIILLFQAKRELITLINISPELFKNISYFHLKKHSVLEKCLL